MKAAACLLLVLPVVLAFSKTKTENAPQAAVTLELHRTVASHDELLALRQFRKIRRNANLPTRGRRGADVGLHGGIDKLGEFSVTLYLGTPPQKAELQVDTGSSDLGLPAQGCKKCKKHVDPKYAPTKSTNATKVGCSAPGLMCDPCKQGQCGFTISYADGSGFSAKLWDDVVAVDTQGTLAQKALVGGIFKKRKGSFEPHQVDGIIGFGYQGLSSSGGPTIFDQWVSAGQLQDVFSMCLAEEGGKMVLGGDGTEGGDVVMWTPIIDESYYVVNMTDMLVNGQSIGIHSSIYNTGGAIVDSGSTDFVLPPQAYKALKRALAAQCETHRFVGVCKGKKPLSGAKTIFDGYCYPMTDEERARWPPIQLTFEGGVTLEIPTSVYLDDSFCGTDTTGSYTINIDAGAAEDGTILGDVVMRPYNTIFDRANKRVGFSTPHCF